MKKPNSSVKSIIVVSPSKRPHGKKKNPNLVKADNKRRN